MRGSVGSVKTRKEAVQPGSMAPAAARGGTGGGDGAGGTGGLLAASAGAADSGRAGAGAEGSGRGGGAGFKLPSKNLRGLMKGAVKKQMVASRMSEKLPVNYFAAKRKDKTRKTLQNPADRKRHDRMLDVLHGQFLTMLEDVEFLHRCFTLLDGNDDGGLEPPELKRWVTVINAAGNEGVRQPGTDEPTPEDMLDLFERIGRKGVMLEGEAVLEDPETKISFDDFLAIMQDYYTALGATHLRLVFVDLLAGDGDIIQPATPSDGPQHDTRLATTTSRVEYASQEVPRTDRSVQHIAVKPSVGCSSSCVVM
eukprot:SAG25_NODE_166_length_13075_cov_19.523736_12_plen_310_part_00